jgi:hypothetical protein
LAEKLSLSVASSLPSDVLFSFLIGVSAESNGAQWCFFKRFQSMEKLLFSITYRVRHGKLFFFWKMTDRNKVLSLLEACFDLISGSSLHIKNSNHGQENYWKSGVQIPAPEGQKNFVLFSFHLQILHKKLHIFVLTIFYKSDINKNKDFQHVLFDF